MSVTETRPEGTVYIQRKPEDPHYKAGHILGIVAEIGFLPELDDQEIATLQGVLNETKPPKENDLEWALRYDLAMVNYRLEVGQPVSERHIAMKALIKKVQETYPIAKTEI